MGQVHILLDLPTRMDVDPFLQRHGIFDYTVEDLKRDMKPLDDLSAQQTIR